MPSAAKPVNNGVRFAFLALGMAGAFGILAGCADHGPTNLYSNPLFGQTQAGATMQLIRAEEFSLSTTAGVGPDQYVLKIQNTGSGAVIGPITALVTLVSPCSGTTLEGYSTTPDSGPPTASETVVFGTPGQAIQSGQTLTGYATTPAMGGPYVYSAQVQFPNSCASMADNFNVTLTDGKGDAWTATFSGTNL